jgi:hypothetical protein
LKLNLKDRVKLYESQAAVLERVAKRYPAQSVEYRAIHQAAIALWYGLTQQPGDFLSYLEQWERGELTAEQKAHLTAMGIDPEEEPGPKSKRRTKHR